MTAFIKVKKKFGITRRDQSIEYFEPGIYEVSDEDAKNSFVKTHSVRISTPGDRLRVVEIVPPTAPPRRMISPARAAAPDLEPVDDEIEIEPEPEMAASASGASSGIETDADTRMENAS